MKKNFLKYLLLLSLVLCVIELLSLSIFYLLKDRLTFVDFNDYLLKEETLRDIKRKYDPILGWNEHYSSPFGERPRSIEYGKPLISTFGDSYTHCDEVADNETWQAYLSDELRANVYNFGVGGFGTGQAYLRFLRDYDKVKTPIVTLGLLTENINRVVNVYRPFYYPVTRLRLTKPRYQLTKTGLSLLPNPVRKQSDLMKLKSPSFLNAIGRNDWWYNRGDYPAPTFPYTNMLFKKSLWQEAWYGKMVTRIDDTNPRPWEKLWRDNDIANLMFGILDAFVSDARHKGAKPVIMILPLLVDVQTTLETGTRPLGLVLIMEHCEKKGYACFDAITALSSQVRSTDQLHALYHGGHVSAQGNKAIARELHRYLIDAGLIE